MKDSVLAYDVSADVRLWLVLEARRCVLNLNSWLSKRKEPGSRRAVQAIVVAVDRYALPTVRGE